MYELINFFHLPWAAIVFDFTRKLSLTASRYGKHIQPNHLFATNSNCGEIGVAA